MKGGIFMDMKQFWSDVLKQDETAIKTYFHKDATIFWHCTNEQFTLEEFIRANCDYPGDWDGVVERIDQMDDLIISVTHVYPSNRSSSFHVVSFIKLKDNLIYSVDEYWADDGEAPAWRKNMNIGKPIKDH